MVMVKVMPVEGSVMVTDLEMDLLRELVRGLGTDFVTCSVVMVTDLVMVKLQMYCCCCCHGVWQQQQQMHSGLADLCCLPVLLLMLLVLLVLHLCF